VITLIHARPLYIKTFGNLKEGGAGSILRFGVVSVYVVGTTVAFLGIMVT
jgi:hypothetical protein